MKCPICEKETKFPKGVRWIRCKSCGYIIFRDGSACGVSEEPKVPLLEGCLRRGKCLKSC